MSVIVTGPAGFIGSRVTSMLLDAGHTVHGIDSIRTVSLQSYRARISPFIDRAGFSAYDANILDPEAMRHAFRQAGCPDTVIHLAGMTGVRGAPEESQRYCEANALGTAVVLELCREFNVGQFILASSSSVYGSVEGPTAEDASTDRPLSPYAASKRSAELLIQAHHHQHGMEATILRYFTVYGPHGRPDMSVLRFIDAIADGRPITVFGNGEQRRDFTYIDDIARGTLDALGLFGCETINLGYGSPVSLNTVIQLVEEALGKKAQLKYEDSHAADPLLTWADHSKAARLLAWTPMVGIGEGIRRTVEWYLSGREGC